ncbi:DNA-binding transcriptional regulator, LysR family [Oryzisolibacter propanilivorax]|uniref:DNA-binding transcriptional regulator, LysR family n=1 Tax=Oryzisolibacter propanilivorax TaxID=1527607 RepID=A0A1G9QQD5_9BURK|nr:LysR family transcriptional regulator [Oryzisolibacter propanilivorax]SDM13216.1 DNA-binding transcriptional regulator, LysR family [Oryzisolibacter propanilivorax]
MDLIALDIFLAVAREGSVTRAAERLGRAQSNVTTRVQQLEESLGCRLFVREGRGMVLTDAGQRLARHAERLLALAEEARQAVCSPEPSGRLRLGAMESTAAARLPAPLAQLHARWPALALELRTGASRVLVEDVLAHRLDCALVAWPPPGLDDDAATALARVPVWQEQLLLALPASHPPVHAPADLQVDTLAAFAHGCTYRRIGEAWMAQALGRAPRVLELASYSTILACVAAGRCAGVLPRAVLELLRAPPPLHWLELGTCPTLLVHRAGHDTPALSALLQALRPDAPELSLS